MNKEGLRRAREDGAVVSSAEDTSLVEYKELLTELMTTQNESVDALLEAVRVLERSAAKMDTFYRYLISEKQELPSKEFSWWQLILVTVATSGLTAGLLFFLILRFG